MKPIARSIVQELREDLPDGTEVLYGMVPGGAAYMALVNWTSLIVRGIRGEEAERGWRVWVSSGIFIGTFAISAGTRVRDTAAVRDAAVETSKVLRQAAEDAKLREERAAQRDDRLTTLTKWLIVLAALTLIAAIVTLAGT